MTATTSKPTFDSLVSNVQTMYAEEAPTQNKYNLLLFGDSGVGKTEMALTTARAPIFVASFDPQGCTSPGVKAEIDAGRVLANTTYEREDDSKPKAFREWNAELTDIYRGELFKNKVGTYVVDFTLLCDALMNQILKNAGKDKATFDEWYAFGVRVRQVIRNVSALPCDTILIGHRKKVVNDVSGEVQTGIVLDGATKHKWGNYFAEVWCLVNRQSVGGGGVQSMKRELIVKGDGLHTTQTKMGSVVFKTKEEPHIKNLLKKAGRPCEDIGDGTWPTNSA